MKYSGVVAVLHQQRPTAGEALCYDCSATLAARSVKYGRRRDERQMMENQRERESTGIGQDLHERSMSAIGRIAYMASDLQSRLEKKSMPESATAACIANSHAKQRRKRVKSPRGLNPVKTWRDRPDGSIGCL